MKIRHQDPIDPRMAKDALSIAMAGVGVSTLVETAIAMLRTSLVILATVGSRCPIISNSPFKDHSHSLVLYLRTNLFFILLPLNCLLILRRIVILVGLLNFLIVLFPLNFNGLVTWVLCVKPSCWVQCRRNSIEISESICSFGTVS